MHFRKLPCCGLMSACVFLAAEDAKAEFGCDEACSGIDTGCALGVDFVVEAASGRWTVALAEVLFDYTVTELCEPVCQEVVAHNCPPLYTSCRDVCGYASRVCDGTIKAADMAVDVSSIPKALLEMGGEYVASRTCKLSCSTLCEAFTIHGAGGDICDVAVSGDGKCGTLGTACPRSDIDCCQIGSCAAGDWCHLADDLDGSFGVCESCDGCKSLICNSYSECELFCSNGIRDQGEDGIDCGGPCPACPTCFDGLRNHGEVDIDCSGPCPPCVALCPGASDCQGRECGPDPICGALSCGNCGQGMSCSDAGQCLTSSQSSTCSDGIQNQDETGPDCGGICGPCMIPCPSGDGKYCGDGQDGRIVGRLYKCEKGVYTETATCGVFGCTVHSAGQDDECACGDSSCDTAANETCRSCSVDCCLAAPTLSAPTNGSTFTSGSTVQFAWTSVANANRYRIKVCRDTELSDCITCQASPAGTCEFGTGELSGTIPLPSEVRVWYWQASALPLNEKIDWGTWSTPGLFETLQAQSAGTGGASFGSGGTSSLSQGGSSNVTTSSIPSPPTPSLNASIPKDVTYHRIYDFANSDTCVTCKDNAADPAGTCVQPGFELDIERRTAIEGVADLQNASYRCPYNATDDSYDCYKEYNCEWNSDPTTGAQCKNAKDGETPSVVPSCSRTNGVGIHLTIPPGIIGSYGYNIGMWPKEPSRPAFKVGTDVYVYAQFFLPTGQDVTARLGVDCTPTSDPETGVTEKHTLPWTTYGTWHEMLIPTEHTDGTFGTVVAANSNCSAWTQCKNSGIWPPGAGDAKGGSCIISRLEVAGYRDFCDFDKYDLELEVDDCPDCTLDHGLTGDGNWIEGVTGTVNGNKTTWIFARETVARACKSIRQFNVYIPGTNGSEAIWLFDDEWTSPVSSTSVLIGRPARWNVIDGQTVVASTEIGCEMSSPNIVTSGNPSGLGHHGQIQVGAGTIDAWGEPDLPCRVR